MQFWKPNSSHDISEAKNWTPDLLGALAISRTKSVETRVRNKVNNLFNRNRIKADKLVLAFLKAEGKIEFDLDDIIRFFYEKCHFKDKEEALSHAMVLLCMRVHIENPGKRTTEMDEEGHKKVAKIMRWRNNLIEQKKVA